MTTTSGSHGSSRTRTGWPAKVTAACVRWRSTRAMRPSSRSPRSMAPRSRSTARLSSVGTSPSGSRWPAMRRVSGSASGAPPSGPTTWRSSASRSPSSVKRYSSRRVTRGCSPRGRSSAALACAAMTAAATCWQGSAGVPQSQDHSPSSRYRHTVGAIGRPGSCTRRTILGRRARLDEDPLLAGELDPLGPKPRGAGGAGGVEELLQGDWRPSSAGPGAPSYGTSRVAGNRRPPRRRRRGLRRLGRAGGVGAPGEPSVDRRG